MNLKLVTITGADESVDPCALAALSGRYPFVEWAFLLSQSRTGLEPRYPSLRYLARATDVLAALPVPRIAVHVCGSLARDAMERSPHAIHTGIQLVRGAKRLQINTGTVANDSPGTAEWLHTLGVRIGVQIIRQASSFGENTKHTMGSAYRLRGIAGQESPGLTLLHDASGGRGSAAAAFQTPVNGDFVGFAGGICPENIETRLAEIANLHIRNPFWIDMESGVRTDDRFDLEKVESVLSIAERYVRP